MSRTALIVVDMLNSYEHADAERLTQSVEESLPAMAKLIERAAGEDVAAIYVNDNYGDWTSNRDELVETALRGSSRDLVEPIAPADDVVRGQGAALDLLRDPARVPAA